MNKIRNSGQIENELIKIRNALTGLKNSVMSDYRNYSGPQIITYLDNAHAELDMAILCCIKE